MVYNMAMVIMCCQKFGVISVKLLQLIALLRTLNSIVPCTLLIRDDRRGIQFFMFIKTDQIFSLQSVWVRHSKGQPMEFDNTKIWTSGFYSLQSCLTYLLTIMFNISGSLLFPFYIWYIKHDWFIQTVAKSCLLTALHIRLINFLLPNLDHSLQTSYNRMSYVTSAFLIWQILHRDRAAISCFFTLNIKVKMSPYNTQQINET